MSAVSLMLLPARFGSMVSPSHADNMVHISGKTKKIRFIL
jgi:hypothetical protein